MTAREQRIVANDYYVRAMQMFEDHQAGLTEFVREEDHVTVYQVTSVFSYFKDYVKSITLRSEEEKSYEGTV